MSNDAKKTLKELENYRVSEWISKNDLKELSEKELKNLLKMLQKEDYIYQGTGSYNSLEFKINGKNEEVDGKDYGFNFLFLNELTVSALNECSKGKKAGKEKTLLDIGSGWGAAVWKEIYSGCKVTAYDISFKTKYTNKNFDKYVSSHLSKHLYENKLTKISGDILKVAEEHPELYGTFDIINCQNVIHFMSPKNTLEFAKIVYNLLKPGGKAFISAESHHLWAKDSDSCAKIYNANKQKGNKFSGHIEYKKEVSGLIKCIKNKGNKLFDKDPYTETDYGRLTGGLDHRFDKDSFDYIFTEAGFSITKNSYMVFVNNPGVSLRFNDDHPYDKFIGAILEKPVGTATLDYGNDL